MIMLFHFVSCMYVYTFKAVYIKYSIWGQRIVLIITFCLSADLILKILNGICRLTDLV